MIDGLMSSSLRDQREYRLIPHSDDSNLSEDELLSLYEDDFQIISKNYVSSSNSYQKLSNIRMEINSLKTPTESNQVFPPKNGIINEFHKLPQERKILFWFSLLACFLVIGVFVGLPCEWADCSCLVVNENGRIIWQKTTANVEFIGPITFTDSMNNGHIDFILTARGSVFADGPVFRTNYTPASGGVVFVFNGRTGEQLWRRHFNNMPHEIDCSIFSATNQLPKDCLLISYWNFITVFSPTRGVLPWTYHFSSRLNKSNGNFPFIMPDLDKDEVPDLLVTNEDAKKIIFISGRKGVALSDDVLPKNLNSINHKNCTEIRDLKFHNESVMTFSCKRNVNDSTVNMTILLTDLKNSPEKVKIKQHTRSAVRAQTHSSIRTIEVLNNGEICPQKCHTTVRVHDSHEKVIWSNECDHSYTTVPVSFDLTDTIGVYGFVFRIWQHEHEKIPPKKTKIQHNNNKVNWGFISERTFIVVFNSSHEELMLTINVTSNQILQLYDTQKSIQPDPVAQKFSVTVADIGRNGSYQLITYYSTFEDNKKRIHNHSFTDYTLKSRIQVYNLEREILKHLKTSSTE